MGDHTIEEIDMEDERAGCIDAQKEALSSSLPLCWTISSWWTGVFDKFAAGRVR